MSTKTSIFRIFSILLIFVFMLTAVDSAYATSESLPAKTGNMPSSMQSVSDEHTLSPFAVGPSLTWNTFLGGSKDDFGLSMAVDGSGNIYVTGYSDSTWGSPLRTYTSGNDAYVAKFDSTGALIWNTFLGGSGDDVGLDITLSGSDVYVMGYSNATWDCAPVTCTVNAYTLGYDVFAAKLDSSGSLVWTTFLGGSGTDNGRSITLDGSGNIYLAGASDTTWGAPKQPFAGGSYDGFAVKLNSSGVLIWNTFQGGSGDDQSWGIVVDTIGNAYTAGYSDATWGTPLNAYTGNYDGFATKLDGSGNLTWNTFFGGSAEDHGQNIFINGSGNIYVVGYSIGAWGSPMRAYTSGTDTFAAKLNSSGTLDWNTFLGGSGADAGSSVAVDGGGNVYVTGYSTATWGSPSQAYASGFDTFAAKLDGSGALTWNTFLGGSGSDFGNGIVVDGSGNVYVGGNSDNTWGAPKQAFTAVTDSYIVKISDETISPPGHPIFADVPFSHWANNWIERLYKAHVTDGCGTSPMIYCPDLTVTRAQMAIFILRSKYNTPFFSYMPPPATGKIFADVPLGSFADAWIEQLAFEGITSGCGDGNYCPDATITRAQMAIFLLKGKYGSLYIPPVATGAFSDVPVGSFAADWIEQLAKEAITSGCGGGLYCPNSNVTRDQMAVFLVKTFSLP